MKLCVPVIEKEVDLFIDAIKGVEETSADLVELRVDYLKSISVEVLDQILGVKSSKPQILTIRMKEEGGQTFLDENLRLDLFLRFQEKVDYIDVEFAAKETTKSLIEQKKCQIIVSMHDFKKTPSNEVLNDYIHKAFEMDADIAKLAVMCNSYDDAIQLLELLEKWKNKNVVIIGMGEYGTLTRVLSPLFSPYLTFVSIDDVSKSASGQVTLNQMRKFVELMKNK